MVIDARIPMSGNPVNFFDIYTTGVQRGQQQKANALAMQQAQTDQKARTAQMLAKGVLSSSDPASAYSMALEQARRIGMNVEGLPTEWGPDAEMAVRLFAADPAEMTTLQKNLAAAGLEPGSPEYKAAVMSSIGMGPDKAPTDPNLIREIEAATGYKPGTPEFRAEYERRTTKGGNSMRAVYDDKGNVVYYEGPPEGAKLGRAASNDAEKSLVANEVLSSNLKRVGEMVGFDPATGKISDEARQMFTYLGAGRSTVAKIGEKLEGVPIIGDLVEPSKEELAFAGKRKEVMVAIDQMFNDYRQEITGAAAAMAELERLKQTFLNSDMSANEFERVFAETQAKLERIRSTYVQLLQRGYDTKTARGGAALDSILSGKATIDDFPANNGATGGTGNAMKAPGEMSDEEIRKELGLE